MYSATNKTPQKVSTAVLTVLAIWIMSILLSFPLFFAMNLEVKELPEVVKRLIQLDDFTYCTEKWGEYEKGRLVYSCFILVMQVCSYYLTHSPVLLQVSIQYHEQSEVLVQYLPVGSKSDLHTPYSGHPDAIHFSPFLQ